MSENTSIPLHSLTDRTNLGLEIHRVDRASAVKASVFGIHRDDHHIFLFQQEGNGKMMVDFREINFEDCVAFASYRVRYITSWQQKILPDGFWQQTIAFWMIHTVLFSKIMEYMRRQFL